MKTTINYLSYRVTIDLSKPISISTVLQSGDKNLRAWYVDSPKIEPVLTEQFKGSVKLGGSVNFNNVFFNPHGHGTHTECVGNISIEEYYVPECLNDYHFFAKLISIEPQSVQNDKIITKEQVEKQWNAINHNIPVKAIIIRTLPNDASKCSRHYSGTNPPYLDKEVIPFLLANGVEHLLIDTPSVDREDDGGKLVCHHLFWEYPENTQKQRTITELIYVPNEAEDGLWLLNLQVANFKNDAAPSNPVIYQVLNVEK